MPNLFSTFGRAALVALGLAVAPAAYAQLTCTNGLSPIITGVGSASVEAVCGLTCTGGQTVSVDGNGNYSCSTGAPTNAAPSGCTLTASPTSGLSGAGTTLKAKCTAGFPTALTLTWTTPSGTQGSCSNSGTVGVEAQCPVTNITQGTTYSVKFSNGIGTDVTKTAAYSVTAGGGGGFASCPSGARTSAGLYPRVFAPPGSSTDEVGSLPAGAIMSLKMTVTATSGGGGFFGSAIYGGTRFASWAISSTACDFDSPLVDVPNSTSKKTKYLKGSTGSNIDTAWSYGSTGTLQPGTYYFNIRMESCTSDNCHYDSLRFW